MTDQLSTRPARKLDKEELRALLAEVLDVDTSEVTDHAHFVDDLEVDSLLALEIAVRLEQAYSVSLGEKETESLKSLNDAYDLLSVKLAEPGRVAP
jgi:acyl carrier protein